MRRGRAPIMAETQQAWRLEARTLHLPFIWASYVAPPMRYSLTALGLVAALALSGCDSDSKSATAAPATLPSTACGTYTGQGCAPASKRVDLTRPTFSSPTKIINQLFPISRLYSAPCSATLTTSRFGRRRRSYLARGR